MASAMAAAHDVLAAAVDIDVGIAILDREGGDRAVNGGASVSVPSASLAKIILATDIIDRSRAASTPIGPRDLDLIRRALGPSDDAAMNELWTRFDGPDAIERISSRLGLSGTNPPEYPASWGETTTTAVDIVAVFDHIADMPAPDRDLLTSALAAAPPVAADGFPQAFGLLSPDNDMTVVVKQGWMYLGDLFYLHTAGLVGDSARYVAALLTVHGTQLGPALLRQSIDDAARSITHTLRDGDQQAL
ncbi:serine hydrolase [Nocardia sp. NPDC058176]|uniref:serine hydrolase n=1 Tax=Nocardia sp. NPDC058176 TaxID=3346368 RepID=UPI0036DEFA1C